MKKIKGAPSSVLRSSKWLELYMLLSPEDFAKMLSKVQDAILSPLGYLVDEDHIALDPDQVQRDYTEAFDASLEGKSASKELLKKLSLRISTKEDHLTACELQDNRFIVHERLPAIKMQALYLTYSEIEDKIRPRVLGGDQIFWGVELGFPQIYQDPETMKMKEAWNQTEESSLFKSLQKWAREHTKPCKFILKNQTQASAFRKSKELDLSKYPALLEKKITLA